MSRLLRPTAAVAAALAGLALAPAQAQYSWNWFNLSNPHWDISVTDYGYSDYLLDHTPGFEGREHLSGEWGGALGFTRPGQRVMPPWLEPRFSFPDWDTHSDDAVLQPMTDTGLTGQGLPSARSVVGNGWVEITQDLHFVDTVTGIAMGWAPASASGAGTARLSNRYVLVQSYTFRNVAGVPLQNLQYYQLLHGLTSQAGVYDNRAVGKPSVGTHLSIEADALSGVDSFAPAVRWVAGAQRWDLGALAPGQTVTLNTALSILTGWQVGGGSGGSGSAGGGSGVPGGIDDEFLGEHSAGVLFVEYDTEDAEGIAEAIVRGEFGPLTFAVPGPRLQL